MPQAPVYGGQKANIAAIPGFRQDANRTAQEYGAGFGENVQQFGSLMENVYAEKKRVEAQNSSAMFGLDVDALAKEVQQKFPGIKASEGRAYYNENLAKIEAKHRPQDGLAQKKFDESALITKGRYANEMGAWGTGQAIETTNSADDAEFVLERDNAVRMAPFSSDPVQKMLSDAAYSKALQARQRKMERMGLPPEQVKAGMDAAKSEIHAQVVTDYINRGDFAGANTWFNKYKHLISPKIDDTLGKSIEDGMAFTVGGAVANDVFNKAIEASPSPLAPLNYEKMLKDITEAKGMSDKARGHALTVFSQRRVRHDEAVKQEIETGYMNMVKIIDDAKVKANGMPVPVTLTEFKTNPEARVLWYNLSDAQRKNLEEAAIKEAPKIADPLVVKNVLDAAALGENFYNVEGALSLPKDTLEHADKVKNASRQEKSDNQKLIGDIHTMVSHTVGSDKADKIHEALSRKVYRDKGMRDPDDLLTWALEQARGSKSAPPLNLANQAWNVREFRNAKTVAEKKSKVDSLFALSTPWGYLPANKFSPQADELLGIAVASSGTAWKDWQRAAMLPDSNGEVPATARERDVRAWNMALQVLDKPTDLSLSFPSGGDAGSPAFYQQKLMEVGGDEGGGIQQRQQIKNLEEKLAKQREKRGQTK